MYPVYTRITYTCVCMYVYDVCPPTCTFMQESNNNLETATLVLYSSLHHSGGDGLRGADEEAALGHATSQGAGDGITAPIPVVDQTTRTEHSKQLHVYFIRLLLTTA